MWISPERGVVPARHEHFAVGQQDGRPTKALSVLFLCPVAVQVPLAGSYTAPPARGGRAAVTMANTLPSGSTTADSPPYPNRSPVADQVPVAGSYSSEP